MTFEEEQKQIAAMAERFRDAAFPVTFEMQYETKPHVSYRSVTKGLSKREWMATIIMTTHAALSVSSAVKLADALIAELNKEKTCENP